MMRNLLVTVCVATFLSANLVFAEGKVAVDPPAKGSVSVEQGLQAWERVFEVTSHPRCVNCHVGESDRPMWSGPSYGKTRKHGMNIRAGESRTGEEHIPCASCHTTKSKDWVKANTTPHAAPRVAMKWELAPKEAGWFDKSSDEICQQLRDPTKNGDRDFIELAKHLDHDIILHWSWTPGGGRVPAPYSLQEHMNDVLQWGVAGMPCPSD